MISFVKHSILYHGKYLSRSGNTFYQYIFLQVLLTSFFKIPLNQYINDQEGVHTAICLAIYLIVYTLSVEKYYTMLIGVEDVYIYHSFTNTRYYVTNLLSIVMTHLILYGIPLTLTTSFFIIPPFILDDGWWIIFFLISANSLFLTLLGFTAYTISFKLKMKTVILNIIIIPLYMPVYLILLKVILSISELTVGSILSMLIILIILPFLFFYICSKNMNFILE